jgi:hypothetical protein
MKVISEAFDHILMCGSEATSISRKLTGPKLTLIGNPFLSGTSPAVKLKAVATNEIKIISVGDFAEWHGLDRLVRGLKRYYAMESIRFKVHLTLIGAASSRMIEGVKGEFNGEIPPFITWLGFSYGENLTRQLLMADLGVGDIGFHRLNIFDASPLKDGMYCSFGLPFIVSYDDPRFPPSVPFRHKIEASDDPVDIEGIINWFEGISEIGASGIHQFAQGNIRNFENTFSKILRGSESTNTRAQKCLI